MKPFKFLPNRVQRLYSGGSGIDSLCGLKNPQDTHFPENWIASCLEGNGRNYHSPGHGISAVIYDDREISFPELLHAYGTEILGPEHLKLFGENPAVLTKLLDSAERLPLQVHPMLKNCSMPHMEKPKPGLCFLPEKQSMQPHIY